MIPSGERGEYKANCNAQLQAFPEETRKWYKSILILYFSPPVMGVILDGNSEQVADV